MNRIGRAAAEMSKDIVSPHALIFKYLFNFCFLGGEGQFVLLISVWVVLCNFSQYIIACKYRLLLKDMVVKKYVVSYSKPTTHF